MLAFYSLLLATIIPPILVLGLTSIEITSYRHEYNSDLFKVMTLQLVNFTDHLGVNGSVMLAEDMHDITVTYGASVPNEGGKPWILARNRTSNVCELLKVVNSNSLNIISVILAILKSSSQNLPSKCPIKKDREMAFFDLYLDSKKFPLRLPEMKFNGVLRVHSKNVFVYSVLMTVSVVSKNDKRRRD